ncbi:MAG: SDR family oxidoreductase [Clostridia bacterium]|nr:SDR family oxidoreductase [Clostridia bacterium]
MKALFIGGTGVISTAVSRLALEMGIELYLFNRNTRTGFTPEGARLIQGDIRNEAEAKEILKDYFFDVVVDWIAFDTTNVGVDLRLFKGKTKQYMFISSASAYQKPLENFRITEETPMVNPYWEYSRNKIACEDLLFSEYRQNGFPVTIIRPSHTYGVTSIPCIYNSRKSTWSIVERMKRGKKIVIPGDGTSLWVVTHNSDFAKAFVGLMGNPKAIGEAIHITSDEVLSWNQLTEQLGEAVGVKPELYHVSTDFFTACIPDRFSELVGDKINSVCFDNTKVKSMVTDYEAITPFRQGIKETIAWYEKHPELCWLDEEWDAECDRIIEAHEAGIRAFKG